MAAHETDILERLIREDKIDEAIILLEENKENLPLKEGIKKNTSLLYWASHYWIKNIKDKHLDEPTLWSLWEMESIQFNSYIQWLPQEVLEIIFEPILLPILFTLLLDYGANLDQIHLDGNTPLTFAVVNGNLGLARFLIKKGANINATDKDRKTALHWAVLRANLPLVQLLLSNGADVNVQDRNEDTPLHLVGFQLSLGRFSHYTGEQYVKIANSLITHGVKATIKNNHGEIPLDCFPPSSLYTTLKVLSEKAFLEQKEKQAASNTTLPINHAPSSSISSNPSAFLQGIRHIFSKNRQQENTKPAP